MKDGCSVILPMRGRKVNSVSMRYRPKTLTQKKGGRYIAQTYHFDFFHPGWVQILAAEQTITISDWCQGTADAVRKHLLDIQGSAKEVLILADDQLYRMDYA